MTKASSKKRHVKPANPARPQNAGSTKGKKSGLGVIAAVGIVLLVVAAFFLPKALKHDPSPSAGGPTGTPAQSGLEKMALEKKQETSASQWNQRANELLKAGNFNGAIEAYKEGIRLSPNDEDLHFNLGIAYVKSGNVTNAETEYREALRLLPDYPEVHNNFGNLLMRQGRIEEAKQHFEEALKGMPEYAQAHNNMGILHQSQKETNEALACFQKAVQYDTNYWEAHFNLASAYLRINEKEKAIAELRETLRINPSFTIASNLLAKASGLTTNAINTVNGSTPPK